MPVLFYCLSVDQLAHPGKCSKYYSVTGNFYTNLCDYCLMIGVTIFLVLKLVFVHVVTQVCLPPSSLEKPKYACPHPRSKSRMIELFEQGLQGILQTSCTNATTTNIQHFCIVTDMTQPKDKIRFRFFFVNEKHHHGNEFE